MGIDHRESKRAVEQTAVRWKAIVVRLRIQARNRVRQQSGRSSRWRDKVDVGEGGLTLQRGLACMRVSRSQSR